MMDYELINISIHTPVKGVTYTLNQLSFNVRISIHTPVKGVTTIP